MMDIELTISQAVAAMERNVPEEALALLNDPVIGKNNEVLFLKGEICFKLQRWGEALNHFSMFLEQCPGNKKAESYCQMIRNILGFFHKDFYNP